MSTKNLKYLKDMIPQEKVVAKRISSFKNYSWDRHLRQVVIMGWAADLFDLIRTFISISANVWSDEQGQMPLEVLNMSHSLTLSHTHKQTNIFVCLASLDLLGYRYIF